MKIPTVSIEAWTSSKEWEKQLLFPFSPKYSKMILCYSQSAQWEEVLPGSCLHSFFSMFKNLILFNFCLNRGLSLCLPFPSLPLPLLCLPNPFLGWMAGITAHYSEGNALLMHRVAQQHSLVCSLILLKWLFNSPPNQ